MPKRTPPTADAPLRKRGRPRRADPAATGETAAPARANGNGAATGNLGGTIKAIQDIMRTDVGVDGDAQAAPTERRPPGGESRRPLQRGRERGFELVAEVGDFGLELLVLGEEDFGVGVLVGGGVRPQIEASKATTAGNIGISGGQLKAIEVPVPPLPEQHRIVAKVDELMALCDQLEARLTRARATSEALASSATHHLVTPRELLAGRVSVGGATGPSRSHLGTRGG